MTLPRLTFLALFAALSVRAGASHTTDNLRDLNTRDLCPLTVHAALNDESDDDFAELIEGALKRYAGAQDLRWGEDASCRADQTFTLDAYEDGDGSFTYFLEFAVTLRGDTQVSQGERRFRVTDPQVWVSSYYGRYTNDLQDVATREVRDLFEGYARAWRRAHRP